MLIIYNKETGDICSYTLLFPCTIEEIEEMDKPYIPLDCERVKIFDKDIINKFYNLEHSKRQDCKIDIETKTIIFPVSDREPTTEEMLLQAYMEIANLKARLLDWRFLKVTKFEYYLEYLKWLNGLRENKPEPLKK